MKRLKQWTAALLAAALTLTLAAPAFAAGGTAYVSNQAVEVDGKKIEFQMYALKDANGNGTNYVKLRDVAHVLNGTKAQFSVGYDSASQAISVTSGQSYTDLGSEMVTPFSGDRSYAPATNPVLVDGKAASLEAISLTDDNGGGYTYFKLRDLGAALGFTVDWTAQRGVYIETGTAAKPETPVTPAGTKSIAVTTKETQWGTGYYVADNGFGTGYLNNGKAITEDNVLELLEEAQKIWPAGIKWTAPGNYGNNWYQAPGPVVDGLLLRKYNESTNYACGGFAAMLSDYLFGQNGNPFHPVTDITAIRAGDVIVEKNPNGSVSHVGLAGSAVTNDFKIIGMAMNDKDIFYSVLNGDSFMESFADYVYDNEWTVWFADGNVNGAVRWPGYEYDVPESEFIWKNMMGGTWDIWSRYPD